MEVIIRESIKQIKEKACGVFLRSQLLLQIQFVVRCYQSPLMTVTIANCLQAWAQMIKCLLYINLILGIFFLLYIFSPYFVLYNKDIVV